MQKQRDLYVDAARGLCILLVVCIHTEVFGTIGMPLTFIAVPMFFFLSGFYDRSERPFRTWAGRSARTLLLPGIIWLAVGMAYGALLSYINRGYFHFENTLYEPFAGNGPVWFLFALFYAKIVLGLLLRLRLPVWATAAISIGGGYLGITQQMPLCLDEGLAALPLYYSGKLFYSSRRSGHTEEILSVAGMAALVLFLTHQVYFAIVPTGNAQYHPLYIPALLAIVLTFFPVLTCSRWMARWTWLTAVGRHSLGIMLTHAMMCHTAAVVLKRVTEEGSTAWIVLFLAAYVVICAASYGLTVVLENCCPMLLGKRRA